MNKIKAQIEEFETKKSGLEVGARTHPCTRLKLISFQMHVVDASGKRSKASKEIEIQEGKLKKEQAEVEKCEAAAKQVQEEFEVRTIQHLTRILAIAHENDYRSGRNKRKSSATVIGSKTHVS